MSMRFSTSSRFRVAEPRQRRGVIDTSVVIDLEGIDPRHLVTFLHLEKLNRRRLWKSLRRYPEQVRIIVERIVRSAD